MRRVRLHHLLMTAGVLAFFALFLFWPIVQVVGQGFRRGDGTFTLEYVQLIFDNPVLVRGLVNSALIAGATAAVCLAMALPLAILSTRYAFAGRGLLSGLMLVPLVLPPFVGAVGMRQVLGRYGPLTAMLGLEEGPGVDWLGQFRFFGIVLVEALHLYPIMLLNLQAALANVDPAMEQSARNLGAGRWTTFRRITLPLIRPGLFAGTTLVLIWSFTELGTPLMFDFYDVTAVQVFKQINEAASNPLPYALVVVMLAASMLLYLTGKVLLGGGFDAATTKAATLASPRPLRGWRGACAAAPFLLVLLLAVLPHIAVLLTAVSGIGQWHRAILPVELTGQHFVAALLDPLVTGSMFNSLRYAAAATALAVVVGLATAILIERSNVPGRGLIDAMAMLPLAVPGLVLAFGYLAISLQIRRWFPEATGEGGSLTWLYAPENPVLMLVIAYAARRLPYVVRSAVAGLQQTPRDLELAAANLGAPRRTVLLRITAPLILANLVAGALLAFTFAMLEVSDSLILAQRTAFFPITKAIYELSQRLGDGTYIASALGVWAMLLLTLTLLTASVLIGRKMGAIFRV